MTTPPPHDGLEDMRLTELGVRGGAAQQTLSEEESPKRQDFSDNQRERTHHSRLRDKDTGPSRGRRQGQSDGSRSVLGTHHEYVEYTNVEFTKQQLLEHPHREDSRDPRPREVTDARPYSTRRHHLSQRAGLGPTFSNSRVQ
jgi:hypothetical protein